MTQNREPVNTELERVIRQGIAISEKAGKDFTALLETLKRIEEEKKAPK